jgi:predicted N-acetyltransferase YhbS
MIGEPEVAGAGPPVRAAVPDDAPAIRAVITAAFGEAQGAEIADLVADLLADPSAQPLLSLVATDAGRVVGHVLFSAVRLDPAGTGVAASILAPLAVHPERHARGIGGALVREGLGRLRAAGVGRVFVLGDPRYYRRFGFRPAGARGFDAPYPIPPEHADAWMVLALGSGSNEGPGGTVICADSLMDPRHWLE